MRYQELYEMVDMGMLRASVNFPVTDNLKEFFVTQAVNKVGETVVLKKKILLPTVSSGDSRQYILEADDMTTKVYKVESGDTNLPFISEETTNPNTDTTTITNNAWYVKQEKKQGTMDTLAASDADPSVMTFNASSDHGLEAGSMISLSEIGGFTSSGVKHPLNALNWRITDVSTDVITFNAKTNINAYAAYTAASGIWEDVSIRLHFLKAPEGTVTVYYYAKPRAMTDITSEVDLPSELISAVAHMVIARMMSIDGQMQMGSGHRGLAKQIIEEWIQARSRREQYPDIVPGPMIDFINK